MKDMLKLFLVALITLAFSGVSFAQAKPATPAIPATPASPEKKAGKVGKKEGQPKTTRVTGQIISLDAKAGTLRVKAKDKEMSFTAETKGAKGALEKVKVGDTVSVSYTEKNGKLIARSVAEGKAKAKGKAKKAEAKAEGKKGP